MLWHISAFEQTRRQAKPATFKLALPCQHHRVPFRSTACNTKLNKTEIANASLTPTEHTQFQLPAVLRVGDRPPHGVQICHTLAVSQPSKQRSCHKRISILCAGLDVAITKSNGYHEGRARLPGERSMHAAAATHAGHAAADCHASLGVRIALCNPELERCAGELQPRFDW